MLRVDNGSSSDLLGSLISITRTIVPASSHTPSAAATAGAASKLGVYGNVQPHVVLPFVVEHAGALGKEAMVFF